MSSKTSTKKTATKKVAKKKDPEKSKAAIAKKKNDANRAVPKESKGKSINIRVRELIQERKYTDEQIADKIAKEFPGKTFKIHYISIKRWDLRNDTGKTYPKLVKHEGKLIPKDKVPKKADTAKSRNLKK